MHGEYWSITSCGLLILIPYKAEIHTCTTHLFIHNIHLKENWNVPCYYKGVLIGNPRWPDIYHWTNSMKLYDLSEWLLLNVTRAIFSWFMTRASYIPIGCECSLCTRPTHIIQIDMSLQLDTSWFQANPYMLFLLNATCFMEKQQTPK
jgi:hypothetical protein